MEKERSLDQDVQKHYEVDLQEVMIDSRAYTCVVGNRIIRFLGEVKKRIYF
ncbi:MAG: hypothetical protein P857_959 [Candidatus Xenolissoclinum pacificiensis L6]|uniref:Uncharacterized protein n=1 Tax=Candidatus Xenolissoclinum pacificiensis L6 TaxID=1401685 RepID=W2V0L6_9RICK|nr:MAG: hypothetical protein P857_959 [Candidatus Xenolissoclinum pacificiensis L6]